MLRRTVTNKVLKDNPHEKWNQFIDLLAMEDYCDLTEIQKVAHLCFVYDAEVQNGGHLQYFLNRGTALVTETAKALEDLGANGQAIIFSKAINVLNSIEISNIESIEEYINEADEGKFFELDLEYYGCEPSINDYLEQYLQKYETEFILIE
ncbi:DMP19 family protein [Alkalihalobacterium alkalinitrilicum]|uniref:DMP19 family protein n=1 Tax=Alkalihalobacterium alkalinitrilicum TaxID=427920 RepID=UPI000995D556|nr:DUF4375 domain-containing protein [Alkalihalobacterium alkalinitrilicum]